MTNKGLDYCLAVVGGEMPAPKYVKKQCEIVLPILEGEDEIYTVNEKKLGKISKLLKLLKMPKGLSVGKTIYSCLDGFQWLMIIAALCIVYRNDPKKRRYTNIILEIARKNGKTFLVAVLFILLFFFEPKFSRFFSVAPDGALSKEIKVALEEIINYNAAVFENDKSTAFFKVKRDEIILKAKSNKYVPLNYSNSRLDGKLPNVFLCDEVGGLPNSYAYEAMRSGQLTILNKLGFLISTKYPNSNNPFESEVELAKKMLDGKFRDDETFALLFEPDDTKNWQTNDEVIYHANPLALAVPEIFEDLLKKRRRAIESEAARENFLCKHCNIIYQGLGTESYVPIDAVKKCRMDKVDFTDRMVYVGVDLAMSNDNCAVAIVSVDDYNNLICDCYAFIPEGRIDEKIAYEKCDYYDFIRSGKCIACGDMTVDYSVIEKFVFDIENRFGCTIAAIGYDRYNALSSAQKWDEKYTTVQIRQHSDTLHPPTKLLYEQIVNGVFAFEKNKLFELNFENSRCTFDTNMNRYVNKKKSNGKVDMVVATLNAVFLALQDIIFDSDFTVQVI
ncbi:MAG: terminase large subunit [Faecalibacterium sp.]|nr:terminase large subunit [Ruminococcus sp.]MCM1392096.1 terminase large subunit [Ruminococcus sp.]MCM1485793.1 terminase large subunit [Faecalibacterium sp.]